MKDINDWQSKFESCSYSDRLINKLELLNTKATIPVDIQEVKKAIYYAKKYHADQKRKSGEPYYTHPLEVAYMVSDYNFKTDVIVTSILHDVVEDTEMTAGMVLDLFGRRVEEMVDRLTRDRPDGSKLSVEEILKNAFKTQDKEVILIKVIDRLHNIMTLEFVLKSKQEKMFSETLDNFMVPAIHYGFNDIEKQIWQLYCDYKLINFKSLEFKESKFIRDAPSVLSQAYQNAKYSK
jgi:(p)ppGpp synthase/HD superfamily hydrolase